MEAVEVLRLESERSFKELKHSVEGLEERDSWIAVTPNEGDYLHSSGSIISIVQHVASCKFLYASWAFRNREFRLRHLLGRCREINTGWEATLHFLDESQDYWLQSWSDLSAGDLEDEREHHSGKLTPVWRHIAIVNGHDEYHAGQIQILRTTRTAPATPPDMGFDAEEALLQRLDCW